MPYRVMSGTLLGHVPYPVMYPIGSCHVPYRGPPRAPREARLCAYADQGGQVSLLRLSCRPQNLPPSYHRLRCHHLRPCHLTRSLGSSRHHPSHHLSSHHPSRHRLRRPHGWHGGSSYPRLRRYRVRCSAPAQRQRHPRCPCNLSVDQDHLKSSRSRRWCVRIQTSESLWLSSWS